MDIFPTHETCLIDLIHLQSPTIDSLHADFSLLDLAVAGVAAQYKYRTNTHEQKCPISHHIHNSPARLPQSLPPSIALVHLYQVGRAEHAQHHGRHRHCWSQLLTTLVAGGEEEPEVFDTFVQDVVF
jgi:hypothetical protein